MPSVLAYAVLGALGCYGLVLLLSTRPRGQAVGRWLWKLGKKHRVVFAYDHQGQLSDGPEIANILTQVAIRLPRARGACYLSLAAALAFVVSGPPPSQSNIVSIGTAVLLATAVVAPALILRPLFEPLASADDLPPRMSTTEDYLAPWLRALVWLMTAGALLLPVAAVLMATQPWYDADRVFWEHLILFPLACLTALVVVERRTRRIPDVPDPDDPGLMCLWDSMRSEAIRTVAIASFLVLLIGYFGAASILAGVALLDPSPAWVETAAAVVLVIGVVFSAIGEEGARHLRWWFRRRLWPQYGDDALFAFGDARYADRLGP